MMYGREPLIPWQMENDLGPLDMFQELPDFTIEETIEKMENLQQQVLEVAAGNIKKAHQAKTYNAKHARNDFEVGAKVWKENPSWSTKQKSLKKGLMWRGPDEVEGKTPAGNYLLKGVKGKGKGKVRNTAISLNQLKRYIARSQNIPAKSDDEYLKVMEMMTRGLLLAPTAQFPVMLISYFMLTLKMTREFLVIQVVFRFLGVQVIVMRQLK